VRAVVVTAASSTAVRKEFKQRRDAIAMAFPESDISLESTPLPDVGRAIRWLLVLATDPKQSRVQTPLV